MNETAIVNQEALPIGTRAKAQQIALKLFDDKERLKATKKALKAYTPKSEALDALKKKKKEIMAMIKEEQERILLEHDKDPAYIKLREDKLDAEEGIRNAKDDLKSVLLGDVKQNGHVGFDVDIKGQKLKIQAQMSLNLFFNGAPE